MTTLKASTFLVFSLLFVILSWLLSSCYKQKPTVLMAIVKDEMGAVVDGATVTVVAEPTVSGSFIAIDKEGETDRYGVVNFSFDDVYKPGQTGVVVVKLKAKQFGKSGEQSVVVEQETTTSVTITIH